MAERGSYFGASISHALLAGREGSGQLTERQLEVLKLLAEGLSAKEIGFRLNVSSKTVDVHRARIMERLQITDVAGLTRYALRRGLVQP